MQISNMKAWLEANSGRVFGWLTYKRFPPQPEDEFDTDPCEFTSYQFQCGTIEEAVDLGHGEWLLGFHPLYKDDDDIPGEIEYRLLRDINLLCYGFLQDQYRPECEGQETIEGW